ncbi:sulfur carrier protein ThiS [Caloranaerobacter azorensis]|uniref:Thiamine biosynthesis protein ThiS n=2 Tax=Caloranaerobacter azorensis TaxID=116090 RepID=A0A096CU66_9FIRM|nr:sulfur carrier protein ThiS [Caloranaerobacter azorensis]KGG80064.1 thiamine biosynthesis protein ThiS [Caloranaerobacter azorensis H53214]QIB25939.1 sulfur carrier protein ThiS [Caloranaerobacter azorensis]
MIVNGKEMNFETEITVDELLKSLGLDKDKVVVEVNFEIVPKEKYTDRILNTEDRVEIVSFVGGG